MTDEEKEYIKTVQILAKQSDEPFKIAIETVLNLIKTQQEEIEDYQRILDIFDRREYRKKYLEEERAKRPKLLYPDADEIYQKYYEQKAEIEKKDKVIDEMANNYINLLYIMMMREHIAK